MTESKTIKSIFIAAIITLGICTSWASNASASDVILADFEKAIPCSDCGDTVGFFSRDKERFVLLPDGTEGSKISARLDLTPEGDNIYFQGKVRRMYLATGSTEYDPNGPNAISFWIKLPKGSNLSVTTYHWRPGDKIVGGKNNASLADDSTMRGHVCLLINEKLKGKWTNILLTPSAFRNSYDNNFRAAQAVSEDLKFVSSIRQIQLAIDRAIKDTQTYQIDQLKLVRLEPTAIFLPEFFKTTVSVKTNQVRVPVSIKNPTKIDRRYRVFISSEIGADNEKLHRSLLWENYPCAKADIRKKTMTGGGVRVAELLDKNNNPVIASQAEISIPAGKMWEGTILHHINPGMLGNDVFFKFGYLTYEFKRDILTTSVIVWDPNDATVNQMQGIMLKRPEFVYRDEKYKSPPGFPEQNELPEGWRAQDIPLNQQGGYFVSVIKLTD